MNQQILVSFSSRISTVSLPAFSLFVPIDAGKTELSDIVNQLVDRRGSYEFLVHEKALTGKLEYHLKEYGIPKESLINIEVIDSLEISNEEIKQQQHNDWVSTLDISERTSRILSGSYDGNVKIWDPRCNHFTSFQAQDNAIKTVRWIDDNMFAMGGIDKTLRIFSVGSSGKETAVQKLEGHKGSIEALLTIHENIILSGSSDATVRIWRKLDSNSLDSTVGENGFVLTRSIQECKGPVTCLSADIQDRLYIGSQDHSFVIWDVRQQTKINSQNNGSAIIDCDLSDRMGLFVTVWADRLVRLYDYRDPNVSMMHKIPTSKKWVSTISCSAEDAYRYITGSHDGEVQMWDIRMLLSAGSLFRCKENKKVLCSSWRQAGIAHAGENGTVYFHNRLQSFIEPIC